MKIILNYLNAKLRNYLNAKLRNYLNAKLRSNYSFISSNIDVFVNKLCFFNALNV